MTLVLTAPSGTILSPQVRLAPPLHPRLVDVFLASRSARIRYALRNLCSGTRLAQSDGILHTVCGIPPGAWGRDTVQCGVSRPLGLEPGPGALRPLSNKRVRDGVFMCVSRVRSPLSRRPARPGPQPAPLATSLRHLARQSVLLLPLGRT